MKVSIQRISEITGFSTATVSNALNRKRGVNPETAEKIFETARELGYFSQARTTRQDKIRLLICERGEIVYRNAEQFTDFLMGVELVAKEYGYEVMLSWATNRDDEAVRQEVKNLSAGLLLYAWGFNRAELKIFEERRLPYVAIGASYPGMPADAVFLGIEDAIHTAVHYLRDKGHVKIGYLRSLATFDNLEELQRMYEASMIRLGLKSSLCLAAGSGVEDTEERMRAQLATLGDSREKILAAMPTAFVCESDRIALGMIRALAVYGIRVPEDLSLIGLGDDAYGRYTTPALTTVHFHLREVGEIAARRLIEQMENRDSVYQRVHICSSIIERESVREVR